VTWRSFPSAEWTACANFSLSSFIGPPCNSPRFARFAVHAEKLTLLSFRGALRAEESHFFPR
jgi:hypothetical protein